MLSLPIPLTDHYTCRLPRSTSGGARSAQPHGACLVPAPTRLHLGPVSWLSEPLPPTATPGCLQVGGAYVHLSFCLRRSREAPLFRGLHRLAVHYSRTRSLSSTISHSQLGTQGVIDALPYSGSSPFGEVPVDYLPGRQVAGHHAPCAATPQQVEYGIDYLSMLILRFAPGVSTSWKQRFKQLPLLIGQVARIRWSSHAYSLPYFSASCQCC